MNKTQAIQALLKYPPYAQLKNCKIVDNQVDRDNLVAIIQATTEDPDCVARRNRHIPRAEEIANQIFFGSPQLRFGHCLKDAPKQWSSYSWSNTSAPLDEINRERREWTKYFFAEMDKYKGGKL